MEELNLSKFGPACGKHGSCVFYKGFKYVKNGKNKIITLGQFFFMKILDSIPVSIGELQLVWEDKNSGNDLVSVRLYFLPECTPDGRQPKHGEDEVLAYYEKIVVKLSDLASMLVQNVSWSDGRHAFTADKNHHEDDKELKELAEAFKMNSFGLDNRDVEKEKELIDKKDMIKDSSPDVIILTYPKYCRYRCMMKRLEKCEDKWLRHAIVCALGGFNARIDNNRVYFCRDVFEHGDLDDLELRCDHLAPNLKGRPRKRKGSRREDVDSSDESSCESSYSSLPDTASNKVRTGSRVTPLRNGLRIDKAKVSKDEQEFLIDLHKYMKSRNSPIGRIPSLGFKQIDLFQFYQYAEDLGGYDQISNKRMWKHLYDKLGGNPGFTSAATCTRRHYEKLLLPYERYKMGHDTGPLPHKKKKISRVDDDYSLLEKVKMSRQISNENKSNDRIKSDMKSEKKQIINGKSDTLHHKDKVDEMKDRALIIKQEIEKMKMRKDAANQRRLLLNKNKTKSKVIGTHEKKKSYDESRKLRWAEKGRRPSGAQKTVRELLHRNGQEPSENSADGSDKIIDKKYVGASVKEEMRNLEQRDEKALKEVKVPSMSQALPASVSQVDSKSLNSQTLLPTLSQGHPMFYPQLIPVGGAIRGLPPVGMPFMIPHNFGFQPMPGTMPQIPGISSAPVVKDEKPLYALNKLVSEQSAGSSVNKSAIVPSPQSSKHVSSSIITPPSAHCSLTSSKGSLVSPAGSQGQRPITPAHSHTSKRQYPYPDRNHSSYNSRDSSVEPNNHRDLKRQRTQSSQEKKYESGNEYEMPVLDLSMKTLRAQEARHSRGESLLFNTSFNKENSKGHIKEELTEAPQDLSMKPKTATDSKDGVQNFHKSVPLNIPFPHLQLAHNTTSVKDEPIKKEMDISTTDNVKSILPSSGAITAIGGLPIDIGSFVHSAFPQHMLMPGIFPTPLHLRQMIQGQVAAGLPMVRPELLPSQLMFPPTISAVPPNMFSSVLPTVAKSSSNTASAIKR